MQKGATIFSFVLFLVLLTIAILIIYNQSTAPQTVSTFTLTPTHGLQLTPTPTLAPVVTQWTPYTNDKYSFTMNIPTGWHQQEYTPQSGGMIVAFSPDDTLPCATCTYVHEGYFSVKIYSKSTDQQAYTDFTTHLQNVGKSADNIQIAMDNVKGVLWGNTAAVENHGWVYAVSLDTNNGTDKAINSDLFQKFASSLKFTYLIFTN